MTPPPRYAGQDAHQCQTSMAFGLCGPYLPASPHPPASHDRKVLLELPTSVGDPDPHVFGPPGSGSGSGSFPFPINVLSGLK
jgi:hypothetical protein